MLTSNGRSSTIVVVPKQRGSSGVGVRLLFLLEILLPRCRDLHIAGRLFQLLDISIVNKFIEVPSHRLVRECDSFSLKVFDDCTRWKHKVIVLVHELQNASLARLLCHRIISHTLSVYSHRKCNFGFKCCQCSATVPNWENTCPSFMVTGTYEYINDSHRVSKFTLESKWTREATRARCGRSTTMKQPNDRVSEYSGTPKKRIGFSPANREVAS